MHWRLVGFIAFTGVHAVVTLGAAIYAMAATSAQFDNPEVPIKFGGNVAAVVANVLMLPGQLFWGSRASKSLPNPFEWALFVANSALWGAIAVLILNAVSIRRNPAVLSKVRRDKAV